MKVRFCIRLTFPLLVLFFLSAQCQEKISTSATHILFVGNSLTYTNDLPKLVEETALNKNIKVITHTLAFPNYALEDHWNDGQLQDLIKTNKYDFVIVQQGPSSQADGLAMLLDYGERISALCEANGAQLVFFMVWPSRVNHYTFDGVINNYSEAATQTKSILCPVGQLWKKHMDDTKDYSYYGPDQFHPSKEGSINAAEIIFQTILKYLR